ncbi:hypothetical protein [Nocardioides panaciterrulae]|uniref:Lipoprotein n=1 Tax=Nocardioides panaciterrulae TaxID=661492 RepID=A0A7Y9E9J8_9ACTN|nr:hypothetical protein [Nocardioides panaciterrulae]NYD43665.1 hypothetical protein [Nocardioides panaciterrulae]
MTTTSRDRAARRRPARLARLAGPAALATLAVAATVGLAGCADDGRADPGPSASSGPTAGSPTGSASGSPDASAGTSAGTSADNSAGAFPGVDPAAGPAIETSYFTARAPRHFRVKVMAEDFSISVNGPGADIGIGIVALNGHQYSLRELARYQRSSAYGLEHAPLGRTTTMGGEPAYLLLASRPGLVVSEAGLTHDGHIVHLTVTSYGEKAENLRLLRSILATWQWK